MAFSKGNIKITCKRCQVKFVPDGKSVTVCPSCWTLGHSKNKEEYWKGFPEKQKEKEDEEYANNKKERDDYRNRRNTRGRCR